MPKQSIRQQLRLAIGRHYTVNELRNLVFDLDLDWGELEGPLKSNKIASLIAAMENNGRVLELMEILARDHPKVKWPILSPDKEALSDQEETSSPAVEHSSNGNSPDLSGANLKGAILNGADLYGANLRRANLRRASLYLANLSGADLREADLRGARMRKANLSGADLTGARLGGADLRLANLKGAIITPEQLQAVRKLNGATLPNGRPFNPAIPVIQQVI